MIGSGKWQMTEEDLVEARIDHARPVLRRLRKMLLILLVVLIVVETLLWLIAPEAFDSPTLTLVAAGLLVALTLSALFPFVSARSSRRLFRQMRSADLEISGQWDGEGIRFSSERGEARLLWRDLHAVQSGRSGILLYQDEMVFHVLPARVLDGGQRQAIIGACQTAGAKLKG